MQGAQKLRSEDYLQVRCNDEVEAQRRRWTFYETIKFDFQDYLTVCKPGHILFKICLSHNFLLFPERLDL